MNDKMKQGAAASEEMEKVRNNAELSDEEMEGVVGGITLSSLSFSCSFGSRYPAGGIVGSAKDSDQ